MSKVCSGDDCEATAEYMLIPRCLVYATSKTKVLYSCEKCLTQSVKADFRPEPI